MVELRKGNNERVAEIRYGKIPQAEQELAKLSKQMESQSLVTACLKKKWMKKMSLASSPSGREFQFPKCWKAK